MRKRGSQRKIKMRTVPGRRNLRKSNPYQKRRRGCSVAGKLEAGKFALPRGGTDMHIRDTPGKTISARGGMKMEKGGEKV